MRYPNYYETIKEARDRLRSTIVLCDGLPYFCLAICDHLKDNNFWMYLDPIGRNPNDKTAKELRHICVNYSPDYPPLGEMLDNAIAGKTDCTILRKPMSSPEFNNFRPFPLGMCNVGTQVYYLQRQPIRPQMYQGLIKSAINETLITAGSRQDNPSRAIEAVDIYSPAFKDCITGDHYTAKEALETLLNPRFAHDALAFHREFALVRGPVGMIFLAYRTEIIGLLSLNSFSALRLGDEFKYCKEVVAELDIFTNIY